MLQRLRDCASDEGGFTLIELLVVILIIGILAAIAIPVFLNQSQKANDSSAKALARNAATFAQTIGTENGGSYEKVSAAEINKLEKSVEACAKEGEVGKSACLNKAGPVGEKNEGFYVEALAPTTKNAYKYERTAEGTTVRTCKTKETGSCPANEQW